MTRLIAALVCLAALPLAMAAPVPTHLMKDPPLYYPVQKGTRWVYLDNGVEHQYVVSDVEKNKRGDAFIVTVVEVKGEKQTLYRKMEVSRSGLLWLETTEGDAFDEPIRLLRCPVVANEDWPYWCSGSGTIAKFDGMMKVVGNEQVEVPAGKFNAVRVKDKWSIGGDGLKDKCTWWFAPNVGVVKMEYGGRDIVLKSFTSK